MNKNEQEAAQAILSKLQTATGECALHLANAYQALTQGAVNRINAERAGKS